MAKKVRVLCWVMTEPHNHDLKAKHVKATWGKRCNVLLFMSTQSGIKGGRSGWGETCRDPSLTEALNWLVPDPSLPAIDLGLKQESRDTLWGKTKAAFKYVHEHHRCSDIYYKYYQYEKV